MKESISFFYDFILFFECVGTKKIKAFDIDIPSKLFIHSLKELHSFGTKLGFFCVKNNEVCFTKKGLQLQNMDDQKQALIHIIKEYIYHCKPDWRNLLRLGANKAKFFLPDSIKQLFEECGLFNFQDKHTLDWWLSCKKDSQLCNRKNKDEIGFLGEELTYEYEKKRIGKYPEWRSLLDDSSGFDFISTKSPTLSDPYYIESKASKKRLQYATFYISRNEWDTCKLYKDSYSFYFWLLSEQTETPHKFFYADLAGFIPKDTSKGRWENSSFKYSELI